MLSKILKYKVGLSVLAAMVFSLALAPAALAGSIEADFGLTYGTVSRLGNQDLRTTIASIINVALSLLGIIALVIVLYGGFKWMTAGGNDEGVGEARKIIIAGVVGLAVILSAYAISSFVLVQLGTATGYGT
ncbi:MAG: hypothetical protein A2725_03335 [Candidatus Magasanikbacteria bacterium RIFCSPHIGHO2_01_FULL_33_34]|uniref:DUF5671 domain-containing protein n=1 Tax=Candidatus Magasanikbacteria bacterium RIFCSPHIGHO2_01_FULL_33_34 TaxID=1798671 RepID=A0A1F6LHE2_9BACT|nr:MAG: hypothetical protein A2725_03335 [Candidatus Magasanikbacteria bacterium RIFCSPHIGHO2_01_FULL_33_34]OGH66162.1 MAG: hypothetical protein A3B83_00825 [Candidatus Magasanikbacteria bacterium RIFCSPHIGHO2_02_FULL_33_17]OGH76008.1 MAG: hypothetical protein A3A89_00735 [Candidatus Magasanikbacteria bacterium RIFCSPLOWO2_01_FULL_33_34]OGH81617.1 MAG: hypothetical protein A3F93_04775 [Candidatus Magasanikbacteria bacterium RIFCSPLOWO2_12_FULL_34_7]